MFRWFRGFYINLKIEAVIFQILANFCCIIAKLIVGDKFAPSISCGSNLIIHYPSATVLQKWGCMWVVIPICQLVEQGDGDLSCEGPWQVVIVLSFHEVGKHWDMSACTLTTSIGINSDTHLVASWLSIKWRTVPFLFCGFVLVELGNTEYTSASFTCHDCFTHCFQFFFDCFQLLLLFIDGLYRKVEVQSVIILMLLWILAKWRFLTTNPCIFASHYLKLTCWSMVGKLTARYGGPTLTIGAGDFYIWTCVKMGGGYITVSSSVSTVRTLVLAIWTLVCKMLV